MRERLVPSDGFRRVYLQTGSGVCPVCACFPGRRRLFIFFFCGALAGDAVETSSAWLPKDGFLVSSLVPCTHTDDRQGPSQNLRVSPALVRDPVGPQAPSAGVAWRTGVPANGNARH